MAQFNQRRRQILGFETPEPQLEKMQQRSRVVVSDWELRNRATLRPLEIMQSVKQIDTSTDEASCAAVLKNLEDAYIERMGGELIALFSRCYLGDPYLDHKLNLLGKIVEHYPASQPLTGSYEKARNLISSGAYAYVEIYADGAVIPISRTGQPSC